MKKLNVIIYYKKMIFKEKIQIKFWIMKKRNNLKEEFQI